MSNLVEDYYELGVDYKQSKIKQQARSSTVANFYRKITK